MEEVVLVDKFDNQVGTMEKMMAHEKGLLHRAFSVFIFNSDNELLIHQRAKIKYHSGGLWTNTCCSHPRPNETVEEAAHRRLEEEMGFDCDVFKAFDFTYFAALDKGLTEHEFDHVFFGKFDGKPKPNPLEVESYKYMTIKAIKEDLVTNPQNYTEWFKIILERVDENTQL
jgi:isopentenyl-diphosphate delta-isomerase